MPSSRRRRLATLLLVSCCALTLGACGDGSSDGAKRAGDGSEAPVLDRPSGETTEAPMPPGVGEQQAVGGSELDPADDWTHLLASSGTCPGQHVHDAPVAELERTATCLVNHARREHGVPPLTFASALDASARSKVRDMVACGTFAHRACGQPLLSWFEAAGYGTGCRSFRIGENLGYGEAQAGSPRSLVLGWLRSPGHRSNLLSRRFDEHGIAAAKTARWNVTVDGEQRSEEDVTAWAHHFGTRSGC